MEMANMSVPMPPPPPPRWGYVPAGSEKSVAAAAAAAARHVYVPAAAAVLLDMCTEASAAAASGKNNIAVADDGAEKSVARYLGSTVSRINAVGKKEKKKRGDSKLGEKVKGTSGHNTPASATATTERRDLTARDSLDNDHRHDHNDTITVRARAPRPPPSPETAIVTTDYRDEDRHHPNHGNWDG
jgi:hypothetical protein